jgi:Na+/H+-dicarboxylate symporter
LWVLGVFACIEVFGFLGVVFSSFSLSKLSRFLDLVIDCVRVVCVFCLFVFLGSFLGEVGGRIRSCGFEG